MVDSRVRGLRVSDINTDEVYDVYDIIISNTGGKDYFLVYNDKLRKAKKGFTYIEVERCMPLRSGVGLTE